MLFALKNIPSFANDVGLSFIQWLDALHVVLSSRIRHRSLFRYFACESSERPQLEFLFVALQIVFDEWISAWLIENFFDGVGFAYNHTKGGGGRKDDYQDEWKCRIEQGSSSNGPAGVEEG